MERVSEHKSSLQPAVLALKAGHISAAVALRSQRWEGKWLQWLLDLQRVPSKTLSHWQATTDSCSALFTLWDMWKWSGIYIQYDQSAGVDFKSGQIKKHLVGLQCWHCSTESLSLFGYLLTLCWKWFLNAFHLTDKLYLLEFKRYNIFNLLQSAADITFTLLRMLAASCLV